VDRREFRGILRDLVKSIIDHKEWMFVQHEAQRQAWNAEAMHIIISEFDS